MNAERIDVLAVMERDAAAANKARDDDPYQRAIAGDLRDRSDEARAAVAELIAADRAYDAALAKHHDAINADRDARMPLYEAYKAAEARRDAALARFGGA